MGQRGGITGGVSGAMGMSLLFYPDYINNYRLEGVGSLCVQAPVCQGPVALHVREYFMKIPGQGSLDPIKYE